MQMTSLVEIKKLQTDGLKISLRGQTKTAIRLAIKFLFVEVV